MIKGVVGEAIEHSDVEGNCVPRTRTGGKEGRVLHVHVVAAPVAGKKDGVEGLCGKSVEDALTVKSISRDIIGLVLRSEENADGVGV